MDTAGHTMQTLLPEHWSLHNASNVMQIEGMECLEVFKKLKTGALPAVTCC